MDERVYELITIAKRGPYRRKGVEDTVHQRRRKGQRARAKYYGGPSWKELDKQEAREGRGKILHPRNVAGDELDVLERQSASDFDFSDITGINKARVRSRLSRHAYGRKQEMRQWRALRALDKHPEGSSKARRAQKKFTDAKVKFQTIVQKARVRSPFAQKKYEARQFKRYHTASSDFHRANDFGNNPAKHGRKAKDAERKWLRKSILNVEVAKSFTTTGLLHKVRAWHYGDN